MPWKLQILHNYRHVLDFIFLVTLLFKSQRRWNFPSEDDSLIIAWVSFLVFPKSHNISCTFAVWSLVKSYQTKYTTPKRMIIWTYATIGVKSCAKTPKTDYYCNLPFASLCRKLRISEGSEANIVIFLYKNCKVLMIRFQLMRIAHSPFCYISIPVRSKPDITPKAATCRYLVCYMLYVF
jgi:hypothetical protein